jgi:hypothetical protein
MTGELVLLILRLISALLLLAMLGALLSILWYDMRRAAVRVDSSRRQYGSLHILQEIEGRLLDTGEEFPLLSITSLGRAPTNTILIEDTFASSEHALITLRGGQWWLEDRHSRNGTTLNDVPVVQPTVITKGDIIGIGSVRLRLNME